MPQLLDREITCIFSASIHSLKILKFCLCECVCVHVCKNTGTYYCMNSTQHWKHCLEIDFAHAHKIAQVKLHGWVQTQVVLPTGTLAECWQQCGRKDERYFPSVLGDSAQGMGNFLLCLVNQGCLPTHVVAIWFSLV